MKCTNCGKNNACYHYKYNINGNVTEAHLCADCAAKMGEQNELFDTDRMFGNVFGMFDDMFDGFFGRSAFSPFSSFGTFGFPTMLMPRMAVAAPARRAESASQVQAEPSTTGSQVDPELSRRREINALREEMKAAAEAEDYEKAAQIRDKLRGMEGNNDNK